MPILCGGTGLYFASLVQGLSDIPAIPAAAREEARRLLAESGPAALHALLAEPLKALQQAGALPLVYCQLLSMQHLPLLGRLAQAHSKPAPAPLVTPGGELDLGFLNDNGTLRFGA